MEKVDELIEKLAEHIIGIMYDNNGRENELEGKIKALAELISARASMN